MALFEKSYAEFSYDPNTAEDDFLDQLDPDSKIIELKRRLNETDYIACKIAEGSATVEEYSGIIDQRRNWRRQINELTDPSEPV